MRQSERRTVFFFMDPILAAYDEQFALIDSRSHGLVSLLDERQLYEKPAGVAGSMEPWSCGELVARSAGSIEKTFGGLSTRLWDDPYEWTLPEKLSTVASLQAYLEEVDLTRKKAMLLLSSDRELARMTPAPERLRSLAEILTETITLASHYQGRAFAVFRLVTGQRPPRL